MEINEAQRQRIALEHELDGAIRERQIVPYYQLLVELPSKRAIGYEVLARWVHPKRGLILPMEFIQIAEDSGRLTQLTLSLMRQVCTDAMLWPEDLLISLNVTAEQLLEAGFYPQLMAILTQYGFSPNRLRIEITENALCERMEEINLALKRLRRHGMQIELDEFGTGYSDLNHLRELPIDSLKIGRSLISGLVNDPKKLRIVEAVLNLANSLNIGTSAKGVETADVSDRLAELGCRTVQGFLYARPRPAGEIIAEINQESNLLRKTAMTSKGLV